jgi:hypothetical protein
MSFWVYWIGLNFCLFGVDKFAKLYFEEKKIEEADHCWQLENE